jgi:hypothetical protein
MDRDRDGAWDSGYTGALVFVKADTKYGLGRVLGEVNTSNSHWMFVTSDSAPSIISVKLFEMYAKNGMLVVNARRSNPQVSCLAAKQLRKC